MKLSVHKDQIIEGLQKAASIIPAKAGAAYLRSIWLKAEGETLSIMSTDANIEFTGNYPAEVKESGLVGVQGRAFVDLIRQLPSGVIEISLDEDSKNLLLKQGRRNYKLPVSGAEWFQNFSEFPDENAVRWAGDFLQELLECVSFCIEDDDTKDAIACLYFNCRGEGRIDVCGLNGHQFAMVSFLHDELAALLADEGLLIQKKYLPDIKKWLEPDEIELNLTDKRLYLKSKDGAEILSVPRAMYAYPDYNVFLSKFDDADLSALELPRQEAMEALGRILIFNTEANRFVFMDLSEKELRLSAEGAEVGSASELLEVTYSGDISRIAFPTRDMLEILGHFASNELNLRFTGNEGPCAIKGNEGNEYIVIIMPMQILETPYYSEEAN